MGRINDLRPTSRMQPMGASPLDWYPDRAHATPHGEILLTIILEPRGSKYPILEFSGFEIHTRYGCWSQTPQILGTWTLWEMPSLSSIQWNLTWVRRLLFCRLLFGTRCISARRNYPVGYAKCHTPSYSQYISTLMPRTTLFEEALKQACI